MKFKETIYQVLIEQGLHPGWVGNSIRIDQVFMIITSTRLRRFNMNDFDPDLPGIDNKVTSVTFLFLPISLWQYCSIFNFPLA